MLIADVNVFLGAAFRTSPIHEPIARWLRDKLNGPEPFGVSELVLSAVVRISTNRRVYDRPLRPDEALDFCASMRAAAASQIVAPGARHWELFADLVRSAHATANVVPDAYLAALAIENGATFVTRDRGFARFAGLRMVDPLAA